MSLWSKMFSRTKIPTTKEDSIAYASGGRNTFDTLYNDYAESVETLDKVVRIFANVASMAKMQIMRQDAGGKLKPLKVKNVDFELAINEIDSQADFLRKTFSSLCTQGATIIIAELSKATGFIGFYPYDPAKFKINATEKSLISEFVYTTEGGSEMIFKPEDIIYVNSTIDVSNMVYPLSRLKALNDMLQLQANIMRQTSDYYSSGSKHSAIITPKEPMSPENAKALKNTFDEFIKSRQTRTLFLNTEVDVASVSNAQTPTDIMRALVEINGIITESFGIPEYLYGNYKGYVNDAAVKTASRLFFEIQMKPLFKSFEFQMTRYFRNTLGVQNAIIKFNFDDVEILHDSLETKVALAGQMLKLGIVSLNEAREMVELPPLPNETADQHFLPSYLVSSRPVTVESYQELMDAGFFDSASMASTPDGNSGGADNEALLTNDEKNTEPEQ